MKVVVALGGNAILRRGEKGTAKEQFAHVKAAVEEIVSIISEGHQVLITHGNGPQVGDILLKEECASGTLPHMPLDICGAESQGLIGYMIQQTLKNRLRKEGIHRHVITIITQTLVDRNDAAFRNPEKPIGPYYSITKAEMLKKERGWQIHNTGAGENSFRRVVPSPEPVRIVEDRSIKSLFDTGFVIIAAGGGGIPVFTNENEELTGIEAVIDKDLTAGILATGIGADVLLILTDVDSAYRNFGTGDAERIEEIRVDFAEALLNRGEFAKGSMAPKMLACIKFIKAGGKKAVITSLEHATEALEGKTGTQIVP